MLKDYSRNRNLRFQHVFDVDPLISFKVDSQGFPVNQRPTAQDVAQGELGDCYLLSALAALTEHQSLCKALLVPANPAGSLYAVKLFSGGRPVLLAVDDLFPYSNGDFAFAGEITSISSHLWVMLVEKAYAKLHGSYAAIEGGRIAEALADLTGGLPGRFEALSTNSEEKWQQIKLMSNSQYILGATSTEGNDTQIDEYGIVKGHAYSILRIIEVDGHKLLCLRNPWGNVEWNGRWSDHSIEWTPRYRKLLNHFGARDDGIFWISYEDFCRHYRTIDYCRLVNQPGWFYYFLESAWLPFEGGRMGLTDSFPQNPQFLLTSNTKDCNISLSLSQLEVRDGEFIDAVDYKSIYAFRVADLGLTWMHGVPSKIMKTPRQKFVMKKCPVFQNSRDIMLEFQLDKGVSVIIIPCTYDQVSQKSPFLLKVFSDSECEFKLLSG